MSSGIKAVLYLERATKISSAAASCKLTGLRLRLKMCSTCHRGHVSAPFEPASLPLDLSRGLATRIFLLRALSRPDSRHTPSVELALGCVHERDMIKNSWLHTLLAIGGLISTSYLAESAGRCPSRSAGAHVESDLNMQNYATGLETGPWVISQRIENEELPLVPVIWVRVPIHREVTDQDYRANLAPAPCRFSGSEMVGAMDSSESFEPMLSSNEHSQLDSTPCLTSSDLSDWL
jgi:hypothetical protein